MASARLGISPGRTGRRVQCTLREWVGCGVRGCVLSESQSPVRRMAGRSGVQGSGECKGHGVGGARSVQTMEHRRLAVCASWSPLHCTAGVVDCGHLSLHTVRSASG